MTASEARKAPYLLESFFDKLLVFFQPESATVNNVLD